MGTEGVKIKFTAEGVLRIAEVAWKVNERNENIGGIIWIKKVECANAHAWWTRRYAP